MKEQNQTINCHVETCKFQKTNFCTLNKILIDNCNTNKPSDNKETLCQSFEVDKK